MINKVKERALFEEYCKQDYSFINTVYVDDKNYGTYKGKTSHYDDQEDAAQLTHLWYGWCDRLDALEKAEQIVIPKMPHPHVFECGFTRFMDLEQDYELEVDDLIGAWLKMIEAQKEVEEYET